MLHVDNFELRTIYKMSVWFGNRWLFYLTFKRMLNKIVQ